MSRQLSFSPGLAVRAEAGDALAPEGPEADAFRRLAQVVAHRLGEP